MRSRWMPLVLFLAVGLDGCLSTDVGGPPPVIPPSPPTYKDRSKRDHVLHNLELAYTQRNLEEFRKLLDNSTDGYIFFFSPADVAGGIVVTSQWGIGEELEVTARLFDRNPPAGDPRADEIVLDLIYMTGESHWKPVVPVQFPNEIWYEKLVEYFLQIKVGQTVYAQNKTVIAMFTVRQRPGETIWQIVRWHDDVPPPPSQHVSRQLTTSDAPVDAASWGIIKQVFWQ